MTSPGLAPGLVPKGQDRISSSKSVLNMSPSKLRLDPSLSIKVLPHPCSSQTLFRPISPEPLLSEPLLATPDSFEPPERLQAHNKKSAGTKQVSRSAFLATSDCGCVNTQKTSPSTQKLIQVTQKTIPITHLTIPSTQLTNPGTRPQKILKETTKDVFSLKASCHLRCH